MSITRAATTALSLLLMVLAVISTRGGGSSGGVNVVVDALKLRTTSSFIESGTIGKNGDRKVFGSEKSLSIPLRQRKRSHLIQLQLQTQSQQQQQNQQHISIDPIVMDKKTEKTMDNKHTNDSELLLTRAGEIARVTTSLAAPLLLSALNSIILTNPKDKDNHNHDDAWDRFWSSSIRPFPTKNSNEITMTNSERVVRALEELGPTYVKFGQALSSRPDIVPPSLAQALSALQDDMLPFDTHTAKAILRDELLSNDGNNGQQEDQDKRKEMVERLVDSLSDEPVAAASVGQVYRGYLDGVGHVAVKVQRPGVRRLVEKDAALLAGVAQFLERLVLPLPNHDNNNNPHRSRRLIQTELAAAVEEFMSRIFEELDYTREANNAATFARLYSRRNGTAVSMLPNHLGVVVPEIVPELCTENVIVMEWIDGTKLLDSKELLQSREENLALIRQALYVTLSQLLDTGVMHADPHGGNLLKVPFDQPTNTNSNTNSTKQNNKLPSKLQFLLQNKFKRRNRNKVIAKHQLAYLDFGLLATIPVQVRDGLVCAVAQLIFAKDVDAVAALFAEIDLLPQEVVENPSERAALAAALTKTMEEVLVYPPGQGLFHNNNDNNHYSNILTTTTSTTTQTTIPTLKFDKLLDGLARLVPRFQFRLPPYFLNNARALATLEGTARALDPQFNSLRFMYPYALDRMLRNPSGSIVVERTLQRLVREGGEVTGRIDLGKVEALWRDSALLTGFGRDKILWDVIRTRGGRRLVWSVLVDPFHRQFSKFSKMKMAGTNGDGNDSIGGKMWEGNGNRQIGKRWRRRRRRRTRGGMFSNYLKL